MVYEGGAPANNAAVHEEITNMQQATSNPGGGNGYQEVGNNPAEPGSVIYNHTPAQLGVDAGNTSGYQEISTTDALPGINKSDKAGMYADPGVIRIRKNREGSQTTDNAHN